MNTIQIGSKAAFPTLEPRIYLNHAAISPPSRQLIQKSMVVLQDYAKQGVGAVFKWVEQREVLRQTLANLIHAKPDEIGLCANTTSGIIHIAHLIPWQQGARVICFKGEFPTNVTPWQQAVKRCNGEVIWIDLKQFTENPENALTEVEAALKTGATALACSAVQFQTGLRMPLESIGKLCKKYSTLFSVDAIQACGIIPINVQKLNIDFLSCGSHKWLMGIEGCGFVYINERVFKSMSPQTAGWLSHENGLSFLFDGPNLLQYNRPIKRNASVVEHGAMNAIGFAALAASVEDIMRLGVTNIYRHVQQYHDGLEEICVSHGFTSVRATCPDQRSGILSFKHRKLQITSRLADLFLNRGISCSTPDGYLRFSPHWPNGLNELEEINQILAEIVSDAMRDQ